MQPATLVSLWNILIAPKGNPTPSKQAFFFPLVPLQPGICILSQWAYRFWTLQRYRIIQYMAPFVCLSSFIDRDVFQVCTIDGYLIPFNGWIIFSCMVRSPLVSPCLCDGHVDCFHLLATGNRAPINICVHLFESLISIPLCLYPGLELRCMVIFYGKFDFLRNRPTIFCSGWTILNSHSKYLSVLFSEHICQLLLFAPLFFFSFF